MMQTSEANLSCWCGAWRWFVVIESRRFSLLRCKICLTYRIKSPAVASDVDSSGFYTTYYKTRVPDAQSEQPKVVPRSTRFWRVVEAYPALEERKGFVVDVGCGEGELCAELAREGWRNIIGVDVAKSRVARAREQHPHLTFLDRPLQAEDVPPEGADLIIMDNVIEHLPQPAEFLQGLRPLLNPRGRIALITPNMESGHFRLLGRRWTQELAPHVHIYLFTANSLRSLLDQAGFETECTGNFHFAAQFPKFTSLKAFVWRFMQESGAFYGRCIGNGPMVYAIGRPRGD